jgi:hypothetical protein
MVALLAAMDGTRIAASELTAACGDSDKLIRQAYRLLVQAVLAQDLAADLCHDTRNLLTAAKWQRFARSAAGASSLTGAARSGPCCP